MSSPAAAKKKGKKRAVISKLADTRDPGSLSSRLRRRRFGSFLRMIEPLPKPLQLLDVGGTQLFWEVMGCAARDDLFVVLLNYGKVNVRHENFSAVRGDASRLPFPDGSVELAISNSVIEHLYTLEAQERMAREVRRVAKRYYVQTPNRYFPMEPHFYFPFFQFLPLAWKVTLIRKLNLGRRGKVRDVEKATEWAREIRLLKAKELRRMFPEATLIRERFLGLTKSFVVVHGLDPHVQ